MAELKRNCMLDFELGEAVRWCVRWCGDGRISLDWRWVTPQRSMWSCSALNRRVENADSAWRGRGAYSPSGDNCGDRTRLVGYPLIELDCGEMAASRGRALTTGTSKNGRALRQEAVCVYNVDIHQLVLWLDLLALVISAMVLLVVNQLDGV